MDRGIDRSVSGVRRLIGPRRWFRTYTTGTLIFTTGLAMTAFWSISAFMAGEPTPWMGASERAGQYATNLWYAMFGMLLRMR